MHQNKRIIVVDFCMGTDMMSSMVNTMTNTLPTQGEVDTFLKDYLTEHKDGVFGLFELTQIVVNSFGVSPADATVECEVAHAKGETPPTRIMQFTHWGLIHLIRSNSIKRTGPNEYAHPSNLKPAYRLTRASLKLVGEAVVSVKILKELKWEPERIIMELHQWPDEVIEAAINKVFVTL